MSRINSTKQLEGEERNIGWHLSRLRLDAVLTGLRVYGDRVNRYAFIRAGFAAFAIRHCRPPARVPAPATSLRTLSKLAHRVGLYLLVDPITFDEDLRQAYLGENPMFLLLRLHASQHPFYGGAFGEHVRALVLYDEVARPLTLPAGVPAFPLDERFRETTNGVGIADFIRVGFVAFAAASANPGFTIDYFRKARADGVHLPGDEVVVRVLQQLSADPTEFRQLYLRRRNPDRRFAMYDFNPLLARPIIRPWSSDPWDGEGAPRMTAPVPEVIPERLGTGIYYQLFVQFGTAFSDYFGYLFEAYCGRVLVECRTGQELLSEEVLRSRCGSWRGKVPDWVWVDGGVAILFECKATRFSRTALATGSEEAIDYSLKQVRKGLTQLAEFRSACEAGAPGLEAFAGIRIIPVVVTAELMYGINSGWFREHIDAQLASAGAASSPWYIISIAELETLQPYIAGGFSLAEAITRWAGALDDDAAAELQKHTQRSNDDSFLARYEEEMLDVLRGGTL